MKTPITKILWIVLAAAVTGWSRGRGARSDDEEPAGSLAA